MKQFESESDKKLSSESGIKLHVAESFQSTQQLVIQSNPEPAYQKVSRGNYWPRLDELCWISTPFLLLNPILALVGVPLALWIEGFSWTMLIFAFVFGNLAHLGITMGYHRLFSHRAFEAHPIIRFLLVFFGTASIQNSVLKWCNDHRKHHAKIDEFEDPYCIGKGFWYAHLGWMLKKLPENYKYQVPDLAQDPLLVWQHRLYIPLAVSIGYLFPFVVGLALGYPLWGLFVGGFLRVAIGQHTTFFVNSLAHWMGKQTYNDEISARDSWTVAFLTHGEGFHNFHHQFQFDYRNGYELYQWDPTKWLIYLTSKLGLAWKLKRVDTAEILKAKLAMEQKRLQQQLTQKGYAQESWQRIEDKLSEIRDRVVTAQARLKKMKSDYQILKRSFGDKALEVMHKYAQDLPSFQVSQQNAKKAQKQFRELLQIEMRKTRLEIRAALRIWHFQVSQTSLS